MFVVGHRKFLPTEKISSFRSHQSKWSLSMLLSSRLMFKGSPPVCWDERWRCQFVRVARPDELMKVCPAFFQRVNSADDGGDRSTQFVRKASWAACCKFDGVFWFFPCHVRCAQPGGFWKSIPRWAAQLQNTSGTSVNPRLLMKIVNGIKRNSKLMQYGSTQYGQNVKHHRHQRNSN